MHPPSLFLAYRPADENVKEVVVTGTFDNWSKTLPLVKRPDGSFELEVPLPKDLTKIEFKFVINDNEWVTSDKYWTVVDETGNVNNYIEFDNEGNLLKSEKHLGKTEAGKTEAGKTVAGKTEAGKTIIPESGLSMPTCESATETAEPAEKSASVEPTVMPSTEGIQQTLGEPGIVVPENPQEISAFKEVRSVDAKELNEEIKKEEAEKETKSDATDETEKTEKTKYVKKVKKLVPRESAKEGEEAAASGSTADETAPKSGKKTTPTPAPAKKEKRGFFNKLKRVIK